MIHQKVTCLTLLDLSAAFDTVDHYNILDRLSSWFGISLFGMSILKSLNHLYSNSFMEFLKDPSLSLYSSSYIPLLSVLSYLIQQQTITSMLLILNFLSFSAMDFSHYITHLENTITNVSNWMSSNFLSLILLKLSFSSLVYHNNSLNSIILPFMYLTMSYCHLLILLAILVTSLITICHLHNIYSEIDYFNSSTQSTFYTNESSSTCP